jgi:hypothetical protein
VSGRGSWFAFALVVAIGVSSVARAAPPAAHAVRIDRAGDRRLDSLVSAIRAEVVAAGFKVTREMGGGGGGAAAPPPAVIRLKVDGGRALVAVTADGAVSSFSADVAFADAGTVVREVDRVALQVAEWLAAIWLPPPARSLPPAPSAPPAPSRLAVAPAPASAPAPAAATPAPGAPLERTAPPPFQAAPAVPGPPLERVIPPPFETTPVVPLPPTRATATLRAVSGARPAPSRIALFDFGVGLLRSPDFGTQLGFDLGVALHGTSPWLLGATPFARLALGLYWLGSGFGSRASSGQTFDVNFAGLTASAGLRLALVDNVSIEASAGFGFTLVWVTSNAVNASTSLTVYPSDRTWVATPGGALAVVYRFSPRWALAGELRANWMVPGLVFVSGDSQSGGSSSPLMVGTLGPRITL